jgi:hypothetical protein
MALLCLDQVIGWSFKIVHPSDLKNKFNFNYDKDKKKIVVGEVKSSLANFGHFTYGTSIKGRVHYPHMNQDGCLPFKVEHFDGEHLDIGRKYGHPPIIMVNRGDCHFVVKA